MIVELISKYLETNRRLVVPNLGAFIVKEAGRTILFSNLIKTDDGVLRSLLEQNGVSELEAAGVVDRFVFEVNFRLENMGYCSLSGFGELKNGANGTITFNYQPSAVGDNLDDNAAEKVAEREMQRQTVIANQPESAEDDDQEPIEITVAPRQQSSKRVEQHSSPASEPQVEPKSDPVQEKPAPSRVLSSKPSDEYVKGLRYGKGRKVVTGRESVSRRKSSKGDTIIKIAIAAAIIATLALAYGLYNDWRNSNYMYEGLYDEPVEQEMESSAEQGVRNPDLDYITPNEN